MSEIPQSHHGKAFIYSWTYYAADGVALGIVARYQNGTEKKEMVPFFKLNGTGWKPGIELTRPLFGLNKLATQPKDKAVFIVEGEKSAAALQSLGITAVTSLGGSPAAKQANWTPLSGFKMVYLLPDNDVPGEHYAQVVFRALMALETPPQVKVLRLPGLCETGDVVDWLQGWVSNWDGYATIAENLHEPLREKLKAELNNAEPVPESWHITGSPNSGFDWEKPGTIETKTPPVQALSDELIPEPFRAWLADVSNRMQTPGDFAAVSSIVIVGSIIGAGCAMRPKRLDDWEVIPNIWGACIGRPSVVLKSPSMKEPMQLLERLQAEYGELFEKDKAGAEFDSMANKATLDNIKGQLLGKTKGKGEDKVIDPTDMAKIKADYLELKKNEEPEPTRRLFKTNETSIQMMTVLQKANPRGLLTYRDELIGLLARWDREDAQDERAYFLEGWNGNGSYTDCKISRGLTDAKCICISLLGGIQPDKLKRYLYQAMQGNNDGLMQRLQLAVWPDEPEAWQLVDTEPNTDEKQRAYDIVKVLAELNFVQHGATKSGDDERPYFRFDDAGQAVFNQWLTELQTIKIQREENPLMCEHFGKFRSLMPSLALIFHCIEIADTQRPKKQDEDIQFTYIDSPDGKAHGNVSAQAASLAVAWCTYLESHARRIYAMAESPEHEAAVRLAGKIKAGALPSPFTAKIVYDKGWHGLKDRQEVSAACNILIDENWLKMAIKPKLATGRPPLPEYYINPVYSVKHAYPAPAKPAKPPLAGLAGAGYRHFQEKNIDDDTELF